MTVFYIDPTYGSDENEGTEETPLKTIQKAITLLPEVIEHRYLIKVLGENQIWTENLTFSDKAGKGKIVVDLNENTLKGNVSVVRCLCDIKFSTSKCVTYVNKAHSENIKVELDHDGLEEKFIKYHQSNPIVYETLVRFARQAKNSGRQKIGIRMLWERARWEGMFATIDDLRFKLCNNYHSRYARLIMEQEEDLEGFFEVRKLRS